MKFEPLNCDSIKSGFISHSICTVSFSINTSSAGPRIVSVVLNQPSPGLTNSTADPFMTTVKKAIIAFLDGKIKDLSDIPIDLAHCLPFAEKTLLAARTIPWGQTISYAGLAKLAGNSRAARATASVMRNNPLPLIIPCHRIIKSDGSAGGFMGKQEGPEVELKVRLLEREGVTINKIK